MGPRAETPAPYSTSGSATGESFGCLPFTKSFRKIRMKRNWNTVFRVAPVENSGLKVLALFRSSWNLKVLVCKLRGKPENPEKNLSQQGDNQKQPSPSDGVDGEI